MRLIDADAFERRVMFDSDIEDLQDVIYALRDYETIADAVEVVRCKDCNNSDWYKSLDGKCLCYCMVHGKGGYTENDFCSRGERGEANEAD